MVNKANFKRDNKNITKEIKGYLENLELHYIEGDVLTEIRDFFKNKFVEQKSNTNSDKIVTKREEEVSHEQEVAFIIDHGIEIKQNVQDLQSEYLLENFKRIEYYGIHYYLRIKDYGNKQEVFNFLIDKYIVNIAA